MAECEIMLVKEENNPVIQMYKCCTYSLVFFKIIILKKNQDSQN